MSEPSSYAPRDSTPTGNGVPLAASGFPNGCPLGDVQYDDAFKALASVADVPQLETRIGDSATGDVCVVWQAGQCRFVQVYSGQRQHGLVAVEPMSGQADCFNNGDGLVVLQAGEEWRTSFGCRLE